MAGFSHGLNRIVSEVAGGLLTTALLNIFIQTNIIENKEVVPWLQTFNILNMFGTIIIILAMPYWGTLYLLGWIFGLIILANAGLIGIGDIFLYATPALVILLIRFLKKF